MGADHDRAEMGGINLMQNWATRPGTGTREQGAVMGDNYVIADFDAPTSRLAEYSMRKPTTLSHSHGARGVRRIEGDAAAHFRIPADDNVLELYTFPDAHPVAQNDVLEGAEWADIT